MSIVKIKCPECKFQWEMIAQEKLQRSNPQNRYFHGVILPILSDVSGYTTDEMKNIVKGLFLKYEMMIKTKDGFREVSIIKGTSELKTDEFEKFTEEIRRWAALELGCIIPEPNEKETDMNRKGEVVTLLIYGISALFCAIVAGNSLINPDATPRWHKEKTVDTVANPATPEYDR